MNEQYTRLLADFAADLKFDALPGDVIEHAVRCIQDSVGVGIFGARLPWGKIAVDYARRNAAAGGSSVLGGGGIKMAAPYAALANGVLVHSFEMDSLRKPSAGVHPGGIVAAALPAAEAVGASGKDLITAFVAGMEVMSRIGLATRHTSEKKGFHAPGLTGVFGAAAAAGRLLGLDGRQMQNAFGIGGSLCSGLLTFAKIGSGGMVKRLHIGRAAEGGVTAASLSSEGFEGPAGVLEAPFGFLSAYADEPDTGKLAEGLGEVWETRNIAYKRCACHITAHAPIQAVEALRDEAGFSASDVRTIVIGASKKVMGNHNITEPGDTMAVQFSVPFSVALSFFKDPSDPNSFLKADPGDPDILDVSRKTRLELFAETEKPGQAWACRVKVELNDGRTLEKTLLEFRGTPAEPMTPEDFEKKFMKAAGALDKERAAALFAGLKNLEKEASPAELLVRTFGS